MADGSENFYGNSERLVPGPSISSERASLRFRNFFSSFDAPSVKCQCLGASEEDSESSLKMISLSGAGLRRQQVSSQSYKIITQYGDMLVVKQGLQQHQPAPGAPGQSGEQQQQQPPGGQSRPVIMTFHDLGLNSELQFAAFCESDEVKLMLQTFTMIHVNFIGQEFESNQQPAAALPDDFRYPTVEQMAECIVDICAQMRVRSFVALAVGAGAHIVSSLALIRPDLVHGLFLINPVISSCSITEWLYFKMSAIAGNHQLHGNHHHHHHHRHHHHGHQHHHQLGEQENHHLQRPADQDASNSCSSAGDSPKRHPSGFRKLLSAATHRIPHLHHHHHHHHHHQHQHHQHRHYDHADESQKQQVELAADQQVADQAADDSSSLDQDSTVSSSTISSIGQQQQQQVKSASARLRHLILSRNFRLTGQQPQLHRKLARAGSSSQPSTGRAGEGMAGTEEELEEGFSSSSPSRCHKTHSASSETHSQEGSQEAGSSSLRAAKRPPLEYLMYHHFGSASLQRYWRPSSGGGSGGSTGGGGGGGGDSPADSDLELADAETALEAGPKSLASARNRSSNESSRTSSPAASLLRRHRRHGPPAGQSRSQDSLASGKPGLGGAGEANRRQRSNSVCLSATYLASAFSSDRQRAAYMQAVYKQYFNQLNAHNLWLFAQSFAKRRTLNLRKDCGAAAHAAAAAAALGTSICTAFVGLAPPPQPPPAASSAADASGQQPATGAGSGAEIKEQPAGAEHAASGSSKLPQALVAGTKVKRTFTCQTLIMCSSVQIHSERALKLMSLLNPLQATWIKTDQLLVLEERPEKVCQALRLFLQGIGYSMSTYERRLRLSSTQASVSSADSKGSQRSLNQAAPASAAVSSVPSS